MLITIKKEHPMIFDALTYAVLFASLALIIVTLRLAAMD